MATKEGNVLAVKRPQTLWPKKRGRDPLRPSHKLLDKVVAEKQSLLSPRFNRQRLTAGALSFRLRRTMARYLESHKPNIVPRGQLILIIDALWFLFGGKRWTLYLLTIRAVNQDRSVILDPILCPGRENYETWSDTIFSIPVNIRNRVVAVICDGFRGTDRIARDNGWIVQRCHFHLIVKCRLIEAAGNSCRTPNNANRFIWQSGKYS